MAFLSGRRVRRLPESSTLLCCVCSGSGHWIPRRHLYFSSSRFFGLVAQCNPKQRQAQGLHIQAQGPNRQMGAEKGKQVLGNRRLHNRGRIAVSSKLQTTIERANITTPCSGAPTGASAAGERSTAYDVHLRFRCTQGK